MDTISNEIGGEFVPKKGFKGPKVIKYHKNFKIVLDTYTVSTGQSNVKYTRLQTMFVNKAELTFNISSKNFFFKIAKFFGLNTVELNDAELSDKLVVIGNDDYMIDELLTKDKVRDILINSKKLNIKIPNKMRYNSDRMYNESLMVRIKMNIVKDVELLKQWFELYACMLDAFIEMDITEDVAAENDVKNNA